MAHSYSGLKQYETCPASYKFSRIDKLPNPSGPAAERGVMLHTALEKALLGDDTPLPDDIKHVWPTILELRAVKAQPERKFAITRDWQPCDFKDSNAWFRGIIDVYVKNLPRVMLSDWKSGKVREYGDQLTVYSTIIFTFEPAAEEIKPLIHFVDQKKKPHVDYPVIARAEYDELKSSLERRVIRIEEDKIFAPNPNWGCRYCHFRKDNGGPCAW